MLPQKWNKKHIYVCIMYIFKFVMQKNQSYLGVNFWKCK